MYYRILIEILTLNKFLQFPSEEEIVNPFVGISTATFLPTGESTLSDKKVNVPGLDFVQSIPRGRLFSTFHPVHREAAYTLVRIFKSNNYHTLIQWTVQTICL